MFEVVVIFHHSCLPTGDKFQSAEGLTGWGSIVKWSLPQAALSSRMTTIGLGQEQPRCRDEKGMEDMGRNVDVRSWGIIRSFRSDFPASPQQGFHLPLARDSKRECSEGSTGGDPVAVSHLQPCYMLPCPNNSFVGSKVALVGSQLSLPFYLH